MQVPPHAYINSMCDGWSCDRGFGRQEDGCKATVIPPNDHLTTYGWECDRGFQQVRRLDLRAGFQPPEGQLCSQLSLPRNAHLDARGNEWFCNLGFQKQGSQCAATDSAALASTH